MQAHLQYTILYISQIVRQIRVNNGFNNARFQRGRIEGTDGRLLPSLFSINKIIGKFLQQWNGFSREGMHQTQAKISRERILAKKNSLKELRRRKNKVTISTTVLYANFEILFTKIKLHFDSFIGTYIAAKTLTDEIE